MWKRSTLFPWRCAISFFGSLFGGASPETNALIKQFGTIGTSQVGQGQKNENTASSFWNSVLSGDASTTSKALAPQISSAKTRANQDIKTSSLFGTRSGGTAAHNAASTDSLHSDITNLIGSLTNSSASSLASLGSNQMSTGLGALNQQQESVNDRMEAWSNSILGKGITSGVAAAESAGMGAAGI
jgi:hypothetical protein